TKLDDITKTHLFGAFRSDARPNRLRYCERPRATPTTAHVIHLDQMLWQSIDPLPKPTENLGARIVRRDARAPLAMHKLSITDTSQILVGGIIVRPCQNRNEVNGPIILGPNPIRESGPCDVGNDRESGIAGHNKAINV